MTPALVSLLVALLFGSNTLFLYLLLTELRKKSGRIKRMEILEQAALQTRLERYCVIPEKDD